MVPMPRGGKWYRSMLFVPGHKLEWLLKAPKYGADAYVYDLEDAVPISHKAEARRAVAHAIGSLKAAAFGRFVRTNSWGTGAVIDDLDSTVVDGLDGVVLPKTAAPEEVAALDLVISEYETARRLPNGHIEIVPLTETAYGIQKTFEICMASQRVRRCGLPVIAAPRGDVARALNLIMREDGQTWVPFGSRQTVAVRAAGVSHVLGGLSMRIEDLEHAREIAVLSKALGADGALTIHPYHVPVLNEVYAPSPTEINEAAEIIRAMAAATSKGDGAVQLDGRMVDYAHLRTAFDIIKSATRFGLSVPDLPKVEVMAYPD